MGIILLLSFIAADYKYVNSIKLKDNDVLTNFKLPQHLMKPAKVTHKRKFVEVAITFSEVSSSSSKSPSKEEAGCTK